MAVCSYCGELCDPFHHECGGTTIYPEPVYRWEIVIGNDRGITVRFETPPPNWFQRRMYKVLLGWKVRDL